MNKPNFFIIGAPKCGTTALSEYLRTHPNIFMSSPKEPHFFSKDMAAYSYCKNEEEYLKLFDNVNSDHIAIGEASVLYLYSNSAIKEIHKFNPDAKIIVMLRNPIDYVYSFHSQLLVNTDEDIQDFEKAWNLQQSRKMGNNIPKTCRITKLLNYKEVAELGNQIEHLLKIFKREQIHFILIDDLKTNTLKVYQDVLKFLEVDYDGRKVFPKINENKEYRSKTIALLKKNRFFVFARKIKNHLGLNKVALMKPIHNLNVKQVQRAPLNNDFKQELLFCLLPQIDKLEKLLNKDLSDWKK